MPKPKPKPQPAAAADVAPPPPVAGGSTVDGVLVHQTDTHVTGPTYEGVPAPPPVDGPIPAPEA